jgi:hypothetical protein
MSSVNRPHLPWTLFPGQINGTIHSQNQDVKEGLLIGMEYIKQSLVVLVIYMYM